MIKDSSQPEANIHIPRPDPSPAATNIILPEATGMYRLDCYLRFYEFDDNGLLILKNKLPIGKNDNVTPTFSPPLAFAPASLPSSVLGMFRICSQLGLPLMGLCPIAFPPWEEGTQGSDSSVAVTLLLLQLSPYIFQVISGDSNGDTSSLDPNAAGAAGRRRLLVTDRHVSRPEHVSRTFMHAKRPLWDWDGEPIPPALPRPRHLLSTGLGIPEHLVTGNGTALQVPNMRGLAAGPKLSREEGSDLLRRVCEGREGGVGGGRMG